VLRPLFEAVARAADVVVLCGDLTAYGLAEEATVLIGELAPVLRLPVVAVLGNHEYEARQQGDVRRLLEDAGVRVLDGEACEVHGVGFAGVKGFGGGFSPHRLEPWGEDAMKSFVREAVDEAVKLESALARLETRQRLAVMHYAPISTTVVGEPPEIFPFLGSSRLEEPLNELAATGALHGHAHRGSLEGRTAAGVAVYNVAMPLLTNSRPGRPPFRLFELSPGGGELRPL
jgi:Icc-related predicted phosphoesterase